MYLTLKDDSSTVIIGDKNIPLYKNITVKNELFKKQENPYLGVYSVDNRGRFDYETSWWENDGLIFKTRSLGEFRYLQDSIPATIRNIEISTKEVKFKITDALSGIAKITATVNGKWILMNYDYKTGYIWSEPRVKNQPLEGDLSIKITDNQGNISTFAKKLL